MPSTFVRGIVDPFEIAEPPPGKRKPPHPKKLPRMYARIQGGLVQFIRKGTDCTPPIKKVGCIIKYWSRSSRLRILRYINTIDWPSVGNSLFITLTYPDVIDSLKYKNRSKHRYLFLRYLESYLGCHCATLWRCEWERRLTGVCTGLLRPHFHLCVFGVPLLPESLVHRWWQLSIGYHHENLQVDCKPVTGLYGCLLYIASYVSKIPTLDIHLHRNNGIRFGRHWGTTRKELIPLAKVTTLRRLSPDEMDWITSWGQENIPDYDAERGNGFTLLGIESAKFWQLALEFA